MRPFAECAMLAELEKSPGLLGSGYMTFLTVDKKDWPPGEWHDEPDKVVWKHRLTGLTCMIVRHPQFGNLCGYVGVEQDHPLFSKDYNGPLAPLFCWCKPMGDGWTSQLPPLPESLKDKISHSCTTLESLVHCHGGLTYGDFCHGLPDRGICSIDRTTRKWFGFDCGHAWDIVPGMRAILLTLPNTGGMAKAWEDRDQTYRNIDFVTAECDKLAMRIGLLRYMLWYETYRNVFYRLTWAPLYWRTWRVRRFVTLRAKNLADKLRGMLKRGG